MDLGGLWYQEGREGFRDRRDGTLDLLEEGSLLAVSLSAGFEVG